MAREEDGLDFAGVVARLDEIVDAVRKKDVPLERSLDLLDEAIRLGGRAVSLVDSTEFSPEERAALAGEETSDPKAASDAAAEPVSSGAAGEDAPLEAAGPAPEASSDDGRRDEVGSHAGED